LVALEDLVVRVDAPRLERELGLRRSDVEAGEHGARDRQEKGRRSHVPPLAHDGEFYSGAPPRASALTGAPRREYDCQIMSSDSGGPAGAPVARADLVRYFHDACLSRTGLSRRIGIEHELLPA